MVDPARPLELGEAGLDSDDRRYAWSWAQNVEGQLDASGGPDATAFLVRAT